MVISFTSERCDTLGVSTGNILDWDIPGCPQCSSFTNSSQHSRWAKQLHRAQPRLPPRGCVFTILSLFLHQSHRCCQKEAGSPFPTVGLWMMLQTLLASPHPILSSHSQPCYGNTCLMLYSLVCFSTSFWSIASSFKSFWMPFLKECTSGAEIYWKEALHIHTFSIFSYFFLLYVFFPILRKKLSLFFPQNRACLCLYHLGKHLLHTALSLQCTSPVCQWTTQINSAPRAAVPCNIT